MRDEIHSPQAVTFSLRRIICHLVPHHSIGHVYARMSFLRDRSRSESVAFFRIAFHRHGRDSGSGSDQIQGIYLRRCDTALHSQKRTVGAALVRGKAPEAGFKARSYCFLRVQRPRVTALVMVADPHFKQPGYPATQSDSTPLVSQCAHTPSHHAHLAHSQTTCGHKGRTSHATLSTDATWTATSTPPDC